MRIDRAIDIVKKIIKVNENLIEENPKSDFSIFMKMQNEAFETLLEYIKGSLN